MRSTTCNRNVLFAEIKVYELCNLYNENKVLICGGLMCEEILNSSCLDFFWNRLFQVVFILNFTFTVFCYHGATVTLLFYDSVLIFFYISYFQKSIDLVYHDSSDVCPCFSYVVPLLFVIFPLVLQKVGLMTHWSRLLYRQSYKKQDLRYTSLDYCIDSST